ncbi:MAG TPA: serine/threonine-protein kinase [Anaerolineae bacterium]|nr:serine/threonine-protein kinase [Anaerolineae bacterium]HOR00679.1 serine/threonine-protein kinase [Anaerolineae bacterium]HPL29715.1 serine/threonine-protein kinase [Anaerolineae bacterium]
MTSQAFQRLDTGDALTVDYDEANPLGSGSQGTVYPVQRLRIAGSDGHPATLLIKVYNRTKDPAQIDRIKQFCQHLNSVAHIRVRSLLALPTFPVLSASGDLAVFMDRAPGEPFDRTTVTDQLLGTTLSERLNLAWQLAEAIRKLHDNDIVHADITRDNVVIHVKNHALYVIDVDGGGILRKGGFAVRVPSFVRYKYGMDACPPELFADPAREPTQGSDRWALAVLIFSLLTASPWRQGLTPFQIYQDGQIQLLYNSPQFHPWPQAHLAGPYWKATSATGRTNYEELLSCLGAFGRPVEEQFQSAFGPGRLAPEIRPAAKVWEDVLEQALRWVFRCTCGAEFVAAGHELCLRCRRAVRHATWEYAGRQTLILEDTRILPDTRAERTLGGAYVIRAIDGRATINGARQTPELRSGRHQVEVVRSGRRFRGAIIIP